MPDGGYYEKRPRPEHREFLRKRLASSPVVSGVEEVDDFHFVVERPGKSELRIYLTNKYILSVSDVMEILSDSPDTNCIVSAMDYNQYSPQAKEYCHERGVGLFKAVELLGAVYRDNDDFLDYVPPKRR
jgi:hypothetical protein